MGGQNNLPADTGRSDLRTWGVSERAGRGPGPKGGREAEIGMRGGKGGEAGRNERRGGKNKGMKQTQASASSGDDDDAFSGATVNSPSPHGQHTQQYTQSGGRN